MAFVNGFRHGQPEVIPDNFVKLWPDVFSLTPPGEDAADAARADPAGADPTTEGAPQAALPTDAAPAAPTRKDTK